MAHSHHRLLRLLLLLLPALTTVHALRRCTRSSHCDDGDAETVDICMHEHGACLSFSSRQSSNVQVRSLKSILKEANAADFGVSDRKAVITASKTLLGQLNPHRGLHLNFLNFDPLVELEALEKRVSKEGSSLTNVDFHFAMRAIFQKLDDFHTVYVPPFPLNSSLAVTGFDVSKFFDAEPANGKRDRRYVVTRVSVPIPKKLGFEVGVEIVSWNGVPVDAVVRKLGVQGFGSNREAQIDNSVLALTGRVFTINPLPAESAARVGFVDLNGKKAEILVPWIFLTVSNEEAAESMASRFRPRTGRRFDTNLRMSDLLQLRPADSLLAEDAVRVSNKKRATIPVTKPFDELFGAELLSTSSGPIGLIEVRSFSILPSNELLNELARLLFRMPPNGLILDLRGNGGGVTDNAKFLVELTSDANVPRQPLSARATSLGRAITKALVQQVSRNETAPRRTFLSLRAAIRTALRTGELLSGPAGNLFLLGIEKLPRVYNGSVVTLVDGRTYSSGDIFTALQVDQKASKVVGTSDNVGAGGATVMSYSDFNGLLPELFPPLPGGIDVSTAFLRYYRTGKRAGAIVENFGIKPQIRYFPTRDDALKNDCDLLEFLGKVLTSR